VLRPLSLLALPLAAVLTMPLLTSCSNDSDKLVIYNAQHEELIEPIAKDFTDATGIEVEVRNGSDLEMANQLVTEGDASPADVFLTENSPAMTLVQNAGLFQPLQQKTLDNVPAQDRPDDDSWTGFAARSTVMVYNTDKVSPDELPTSLSELADPAWKGRISFSPTGADFQAIVAGYLALNGEDATKQWLEGLKANGTVYDGNDVVLESVNSGQSDAGIIYHYYWYRDQEESGDNSDNTKLLFFKNQDPGAFLSVSGAGVLANGDHNSEAQQFVEYLTSREGQQAIADSYALEYPLNPQVPLERAGVPALSSLQPPPVDVSQLDSEKVTQLMTDVGFL
jgi:iron(III) transport system substrate-binding protein